MNHIQTTYKHEIAFVRILIPFILGILSYYGCTNDWALNQLILTNSVLFFYLFFRKNVYKKPGKTGDKSLNGFILHLLFFFSGSLCSTLYNDHNNTDYYLFKKQNYLKIRIIDEPKNKQNIILFTGETSESINVNNYKSNQTERKYNIQSSSGKIKVTILKNTDTTFYLKYGDELIIPAKPTEIKPPLNPSEFDYKSWLASQNIYHQFFIKQEELIKLKNHTSNSLISFALQLREKQVRIYRSLIKDDDAFAVASTLILGYRADLSSEIFDIYSKTGTIHALSVSGMHVGLVYFILNYLLWFLNGKQNWKIIKALVILISVWFYALLTGFSPSVLRASIMISAFITAKLLAKNTNSYNIIAFSAFCILLLNPFLIWDVGFQLSFLAVLGLIYLQPKIEKWLPLKHFWLSKLWSLTAMSLAAQLATYPFSVYYFHQFPIYFLFSNLFITIPTALIMYIGIIILIFRLNSLGPLFEWFIKFTNNGLDQIASLPFSGITSIWLDRIELGLLCFSILLFTMALAEFRKQLLLYSVALFLFLQCSVTYHKLMALHQKKVIHFKLKKNYAIAIIAAQRAILFTDLTPTSKAFNYAVKPALDQHRITQITFRSSNITNVLKDNLIFD